MFITKTSLPRRTVLRGLGATLALPLLDAMVPALTPTVQHRGRADAAVRRRLRADGRAAEPLDAGDDRRRASSSARSSSRSSRSATTSSWSSNIDRPLQGTHAVSTGTWLTGLRAEAHRGRGLRRRHVARPDHRRADRRGHRVPVARDRHRGLHRLRRRVRRRLQLRLHEHHLVEDADDADADGDQPARRVRAHVRPARARPSERRAAHAAEPQHPRLGAGRRVALERGLGRARHASGSTSISSTCARSKARIQRAEKQATTRARRCRRRRSASRTRGKSTPR